MFNYDIVSLPHVDAVHNFGLYINFFNGLHKLILVNKDCWFWCG